MPDLRERAIGAATEAVACFRAAPQFEVSQVDQTKFQAVYPLAAHAIEQVEAAQLLIGASRPYAAEANARAAFQHAVTAQWVLLTDGGETELVSEMKRTHSATVKDFSLSASVPDDLLSAANEKIASQGPARDFWRMCERFSRDKALYVLFRRLSDSVHPSLRTFTYHLEADDARGVFGLRANSPLIPEPDLVISLAVSAMLALSAVESLRKEQERMPLVIALAERWNVPLDLRGDDVTRTQESEPN